MDKQFRTANPVDSDPRLPYSTYRFKLNSTIEKLKAQVWLLSLQEISLPCTAVITLQ